MRAKDLSVRYGDKLAIEDVSIEVRANEILALIGPSGCGKSTFLRSLNRMNDKIEDLVSELREIVTIVIVTHNMQQAARVSQRTGFFYMARLVEVDETMNVFTRPKERETEDYITGRFG